MRGVKLKGYDLDKYDLLASNKYRDYFYSKKDVERTRKRDEVEVYVISIGKQALGQVKEQQWSARNLIKSAKYTDRFTVKNEEVYINNCKLDLISYYDFWHEQDDLDKSGYLVIDKRRSLRATLEQSKVDELNKVRDTAFKEENAKIYLRLIFAKETIIKELQEASTRDEIARIVNRVEDLRSAFGSYEKHLDNLRNVPNPNIREWNKYKSVSDVQKELQDMNTYISEHFCKDILTNYAL